MYTQEEVLAELNKLSWDSPENFRNNQKDTSGKYLLFRGHDLFEDNVFQTKGLVHLTPFFNVACSIFRFKLSMNYTNFPPRYFFISIYTGGKDNKFYPDGTLEDVVKGEQPDNGVSISEIAVFDEVKHFETRKMEDNTKITTYIVKFENALRKDCVKIAKISDTLKDMLITNKKTNTNQILMIERQQNY